MTFGEALERLKDGEAVRRDGWNGKGMLIWLRHGSVDPDGPDGEKFRVGGVDCGLFNEGDTGTGTRMPCLCMRAADGATVEGWLASQTDMLAEDWLLVAPGEDET